MKRSEALRQIGDIAMELYDDYGDNYDLLEKLYMIQDVLKDYREELGIKKSVQIKTPLKRQKGNK